MNDTTPELRLTIIKHLAAGKSADVVSAIVSIPRNDIIGIARHHGYPDKDKLAWAADILEKNLHEGESAAIPEASHEAARTLRGDQRPPVAPPASPTPRPTPIHRDEPRTPPAPARPDEIRVLLNAAKAATPKRIQTMANKIFDQLDQLRLLVDAETEKQRARDDAERAKAAARAEVDRLEKELAAARAKLNPGPDPVTIRAWAADAGIECRPTGPVPHSVREAYHDAHTDEVA